jgi:hemolysin activation/secretion protein
VALVASFGLIGRPGAAQPVGPERQAQDVQARQEQLQRERQQELIQRQRTAPAGEPLVPAPTAPADTGACTAVRSVEITGMSRFERARFERELAVTTGACVRLGDINALLRAITNAYVAKGFVTSRALVGPQDLSDGVLQIIVVEGELEAVRSASGDFSRAHIGLAFPGLAGEDLNLRDLEQGLDQLNRLPSSNAKIDIQPGQADGASIVLIRRERPAARRVRASLSADNTGQESTGRVQGTATLDVDNPLGLADFWSVYYARDLDEKAEAGTEAFGGFASLPYGYWTLSVSGGAYSYESQIRGLEQTFSSTGESWNALVNLDRLMFRDADTKLTLSGSLRVNDTQSAIRGIELRSGTYRLTTAGLAAQLQQRAGGGLLTGGLGLRAGIDALGAEAADTGPDGPSTEFYKLTASLGFQRPGSLLGRDLFYSAQLAAQATDRDVLPAERFSLGGPSTVRGFSATGISGDNGLFMRHQLNAPVLRLGQAAGGMPELRLAAFVGSDSGVIFRDPADAFERGYLQSVAAGLEISFARIEAEITAAAPITAPSFVEYDPVEVTASVRLRL